MNFILLTQYDGKIVGPVAKLLGLLMDGLFNGLSAIGIPNIGLAIILFTIVVNILLIPLTIRSQKNMKLNTAISPEVAKVTEKYRGKRDQASLEKSQKETQMIYDKYGYSPMSGCLPTLIQFPIMLALYRVIYQIPGYVTAIKEQFGQIVDMALGQGGFVSKIAELATENGMSPDKFNFDGKTEESVNYIIDLFYKFDNADWNKFTEIFPALKDTLTPHLDKISEMNSFLGGINLAEAPGFKLSIALLIPFLAWFTQWLSIKVSTAGQDMSAAEGTAGATMKSMNTFMPIMSAVFCFTMPAGLGLYWIASAVVRTVIQVFVNKHFDRIGTETLIEECIEKQNKKRAKQGLPEIKSDGTYVHNGKTVSSTQNVSVKKAKTMPSSAKNTTDSSAYYNKQYEKGSIAARARMVKEFDDKKEKK
ncbi:MAG: YidC/Oxa1 family membrane protein insertase [Lachnospiraceae bacterium]|nr:YidC/Oxa1 family membrane protein insertase [Lachnospiraceae bacterium]